jgi:hypothetical protein
MSTLFCEQNKKVFLQKCLTTWAVCAIIIPEGKRKEMKKMKKFFGWLSLVLWILVAAILGGMINQWINEPKHEIYPLTVQVIELDREDDIVTCVDGAGNGWEFYGVEDWQIGDFASLLMDNNGTPETIYDDVITMTHYAGIFEG